jgi:hypothetical protein
MEIWDTLWPFGTFCIHLVHFYGFGIMYQEKSGNPGMNGRHLHRIIEKLKRFRRSKASQNGSEGPHNFDLYSLSSYLCMKVGTRQLNFNRDKSFFLYFECTAKYVV